MYHFRYAELIQNPCDRIGASWTSCERVVMDAAFPAVTSNTEELRCDELADRDLLPHWGKGVVTLLGFG